MSARASASSATPDAQVDCVAGLGLDPLEDRGRVGRVVAELDGLQTLFGKNLL